MTAPEQDFPAETARLLDCAAGLCAAHGAQLTPLRRSVLGLLIAAGRPIGAYDLLQRLGRAAPPTVYRALDFLLAEGLVHKIERLSAYVACTRHLRHDHVGHAHSVQFLICRKCGRAEEIEDAATDLALARAAAGQGFRLAAAKVEAEGVCAGCAVG